MSAVNTALFDIFEGHMMQIWWQFVSQRTPTTKIIQLIQAKMTPKNTEELIDDPNGMSDELLGETELLHAMAELYLI